jgi:hypothetical protein
LAPRFDQQDAELLHVAIDDLRQAADGSGCVVWPGCATSPLAIRQTPNGRWSRMQLRTMST